MQNAALPVRVGDSGRDRAPLRIGVDVPSKPEVQAMLAAAGRWRAGLMVLVFCGLRASEWRGLSWEDINFERRTLTVRQRADRWGTIGRPKSKHGYREIPLAPIVVNALKEWRLASSRHGDSDLVFPNRVDAVFDHLGLLRILDAIQRHAGVVDADGKAKYGPHTLRHFFASWCIEQGFSPKRMQALLGHGSITMTSDVYGHLFPNLEDDHQRFAAGELAVLGPVRHTVGT